MVVAIEAFHDDGVVAVARAAVSYALGRVLERRIGAEAIGRRSHSSDELPHALLVPQGKAVAVAQMEEELVPGHESAHPSPVQHRYGGRPGSSVDERQQFRHGGVGCHTLLGNREGADAFLDGNADEGETDGLGATIEGLLERRWMAEGVALPVDDATGPEALQVLPGLSSFGHHGTVDATSQRRQGLEEDPLARVQESARHQGSIDLQEVGRQLHEQLEVAEARAEVVHCEEETLVPEWLDGCREEPRIDDMNELGELENHPFCAEARGAGLLGQHTGLEAGIEERRSGKIQE